MELKALKGAVVPLKVFMKLQIHLKQCLKGVHSPIFFGGGDYLGLAMLDSQKYTHPPSISG